MLRCGHNHPQPNQRVVIVHARFEDLSLTDAANPAHCFGPFENENEAKAWNDSMPSDSCTKMIIDIYDPKDKR